MENKAKFIRRVLCQKLFIERYGTYFNRRQNIITCPFFTMPFCLVTFCIYSILDAYFLVHMCEVSKVFKSIAVNSEWYGNA